MAMVQEEGSGGAYLYFPLFTMCDTIASPFPSPLLPSFLPCVARCTRPHSAYSSCHLRGIGRPSAALAGRLSSGFASSYAQYSVVKGG